MGMYDERIAAHYAAYRPPLHEIILERALCPIAKQTLGLDIGCGTGRSTQALCRYCQAVVGIDPSAAMLQKAQPDENITYINAAAEKIPLDDNAVDLVTLAGSLFYTNRDRLVEELLRVCTKTALVVVYDFSIDLSPIESLLEIEQRRERTAYDHSVNLHGHTSLQEVSVVKDEISLNLTAIQLAHLLLASNSRYEWLQKKYQCDDPFESLRIDIDHKVIGELVLAADIFYSLYSLK